MLAIAAALWTALLIVAYVAGAGVARHQVESATVAFVVFAFVARLAGTRLPDAARDVPSVPSLWSLGWWGLAGLILYWPALSLGWLSDDFVLVERVRAGAFGFVHAELFRPLPLMAWRLLLAFSNGPVILHLLNVVLHGAAAGLTARLARRLGLPAAAALAAGALVLMHPLAVEAVAWTSGVFDLSATVLALTAVLIALRYGEAPPPARRLAFAACCLAALLAKESGAVTPVLAGLVVWASGRVRRPLLTDLAAVTVVFAVTGIARLALASAAGHQAITRYVLQRWLFGSIAGLAVPWHEDLLGRWPWLALVTALPPLALAAWFAVRGGSPRATRRAAALAAWVLVATAPTVAFFFVAPDLQGARYLYLSTVGWALLIVTMAAEAAPRLATTATLVVLIVTGGAGVRAHLEAWTAAAALRDRVLAAAGQDARLRRCDGIAVADLPDAVRGAYVFRNGAVEAFRAIGLSVVERAAPDCTFRYSP